MPGWLSMFLRYAPFGVGSSPYDVPFPYGILHPPADGRAAIHLHAAAAASMHLRPTPAMCPCPGSSEASLVYMRLICVIKYFTN